MHSLNFILRKKKHLCSLEGSSGLVFYREGGISDSVRLGATNLALASIHLPQW